MNEYLLGVAEKIIEASVPKDIVQKYFQLKKSLLKKEAAMNVKTEVSQNDNNYVEWVKEFSAELHGLEEKKISLKENEIVSCTRNVPDKIQEQATMIKKSITKLMLRSQLQNDENSQIAQDNKWLIEKMEGLIQENKVLRRMIGKQ